MATKHSTEFKIRDLHGQILHKLCDTKYPVNFHGALENHGKHEDLAQRIFPHETITSYGYLYAFR